MQSRELANLARRRPSRSTIRLRRRPSWQRPADAGVEPMERRPERSKLTIGRLLRPHIGILILGITAVCVEGAANLAEPWPLKVVLDNVLKSKPGHAWVHHLIPASSLADKVAVLKLAAFAVLLIAA